MNLASNLSSSYGSDFPLGRFLLHRLLLRTTTTPSLWQEKKTNASSASCNFHNCWWFSIFAVTLVPAFVEVRCVPQFQGNRCTERISQPSLQSSHRQRHPHVPRRRRAPARELHQPCSPRSHRAVKIRCRCLIRELRHLSLVFTRARAYHQVRREEADGVDPCLLRGWSFTCQETVWKLRQGLRWTRQEA